MVVCMTGTSSYIASWLVKLLLSRGYTVHATVRSMTTHLSPCRGRFLGQRTATPPRRRYILKPFFLFIQVMARRCT
jgi:hypothetical protein